MSFLKCIVVLLVIADLSAARADADDQALDLIIHGGRIVDGTGAPWYVADVGIRDGKIAKIGRIDSKSASQVIDAEGLIVAPGFIDMMGQTATPMLRDPSTAINLLTQGITTINAGEGSSAAPLGEPDSESLGWQTMAEYFHLLEQKGMPVNVVQSVGHTQVRELVMGEDDGQLTAEHGGSLPGTNTQLVRRSDGRNYAILFNTRMSPHTSRIVSALLPDLDAAISEVQSWPSRDLLEASNSAE